MKQIIAILIICTARLTSSTTLNISNSCNCNELMYDDCLSGFSNCNWNVHTKECVEISCQSIEWSNHCVWSSDRCYWFNKQCNNFTSCESIPGQTQQECIEANIYCPASNGINCLPMEYQQNCSQITDIDTCNSYYSPDGKCMWNGIGCIILQSCTELWTNKTKSCIQTGCYFDVNTYSCQDMKCSKHVQESQCLFGAPTIGPYLNNLIPCQWDSSIGLCQNAIPDQYPSDECYTYSARTYHWSGKKTNKGSCIPCQSWKLSIIIGFMITIII